MRPRGKLGTAARLIEILRARRRAAEASLLSARSAEQAAREAEHAARADSRAAHDDWMDYVSRPGFSPELSRSLSLRLLDRESEADAAALRVRIAMDLCGRRRRDWQLLEAQTRSGQASLRTYERKIRRRREEDRLGRVADLTTYAWSRP